MDDLTQQDSVIEPQSPIDASVITEPEPPSETEQWQLATKTLQEMLESGEGIVSSRALRPELEKRGIVNAREVCIKLKLLNFDDPDPTLPLPGFTFYHSGRSFFSAEAYRDAEEETEAAAEEAEREIEAEEEYEEEAPSERKKYRQEEARLCKYVERCLEGLYASDYGPDVQVAYDIHNERPGSEFENMDVIAVHWRSNEVVELVGVEVKLDFSPLLVLQAANYKRFSHRVWAAVVVETEDAGFELREYNPLLFEHVIEGGIGILACRRRQGGAYEVWPIHWPRLNTVDSIAQSEFVDRYRDVFEEARVVKSEEDVWQPRFR